MWLIMVGLSFLLITSYKPINNSFFYSFSVLDLLRGLEFNPLSGASHPQVFIDPSKK